MVKTTSQQIHFKLNSPYDKQIIEEAKKERRKVNNLVRIITEEHLDKVNEDNNDNR